MFDNVGKKIKGLAEVVFFLEIMAFIIIGFVVIAKGGSFLAWGILIFALGAISAWISALLLYGFGELIDKICDIERNTRIRPPRKSPEPYSNLNAHGLIKSDALPKRDLKED